MKFFPKILVKPNVLKNLSVIFEIVVSLTQLLRGICSQVPTLSLDKLFHHLNCLLNKRKGCNRPLTSEIYFISSRFTLPTHLSKSDKKGPAWSLGAQGYLIPSSPIVRFLATPRRHIITSPDTLATITNSSWYVSYRFLIFSGIFSKSATSYSLIHRGPTTGAQAVCGPLQRYQWRAEAFMKNFQIWNMLKSVRGYICLTEFLALDKVHLHKNNEEYLFCVPLLFWFYVFIDFTIKLEGRPSDNPPLEHITGQALCSSLPQLSLS